jgi:hypothetical protein
MILDMPLVEPTRVKLIAPIAALKARIDELEQLLWIDCSAPRSSDGLKKTVV